MLAKWAQVGNPAPIFDAHITGPAAHRVQRNGVCAVPIVFHRKILEEILYRPHKLDSVAV